MENLHRTPLYPLHQAAGAKLVDFAGWEMPLQYPGGISEEHLATRSGAGLFDVSHMGRFTLGGSDVLPFLQHLLSNNAAALEPGEAQYTIIPNETGGALDDAYLYRFDPEEYLLIVNASNREADWNHLQKHLKDFPGVTLRDQTFEIAMISLQGPRSKEIITALMTEGQLPPPMRNALGRLKLAGTEVKLARTGYTGEPLCFELFCSSEEAPALWEKLTAAGAVPVGLGARDTLRLEAGLPLYGHELGLDPEGNEIPLFACSLARFAVSFSPLKGDFVGRKILLEQKKDLEKIQKKEFEDLSALTRVSRSLALTDKGISRQGDKVYRDGKAVGIITSGTMVPYYITEGEGIASRPGEEKGKRAICLALVDPSVQKGDPVEVEIRGKLNSAVIVPYHLRGEAAPQARVILWDEIGREKSREEVEGTLDKVRTLIKDAAANTRWRQEECINLIPSEQTVSPLVRRLAMLDPSGRYAEHKPVAALKEAEVFYYQGTDFIGRVEELLQEELKRFFGCAQAETRVISGQMANTAVFSSLVDYINRTDRKAEPRRLERVMNHHIIRGGHLSAQPMGALRDFVARNPRTEKPWVINFPVLADNPYRIDVEACEKLIVREKPELIILGKSMILYREPVAEIRKIIDREGLKTVLMYDMAHVLGLAGPRFQDPFQEGADIVTGSTHKTFFGPQRGIITSNYHRDHDDYGLWEAVNRRAFPGSVSNHHLGTQLALYGAALEMNHFKDAYQKAVVDNARHFARALTDCGLKVAGDPALGYTETHQVVIEVGYARGAELARTLEENNIIVNYQASPEEERFTASGALRTGVQEMTRFGMGKEGFSRLARLIADAVAGKKGVGEEAAKLRAEYRDIQYCFTEKELSPLLEELHRLV